MASCRREEQIFIHKMKVIVFVFVLLYLFLVHLPGDLAGRRRWLLSKEPAGHMIVTWEISRRSRMYMYDTTHTHKLMSLTFVISVC